MLILKGDCCIIFINTISGGNVNFGGANKIAPVTISKTTSGTLPSTSGQMAAEDIIPSNLTGAIEGVLPS